MDNVVGMDISYPLEQPFQNAKNNSRICQLLLLPKTHQIPALKILHYDNKASFLLKQLLIAIHIRTFDDPQNPPLLNNQILGRSLILIFLVNNLRSKDLTSFLLPHPHNLHHTSLTTEKLPFPIDSNSSYLSV